MLPDETASMKGETTYIHQFLVLWQENPCCRSVVVSEVCLIHWNIMWGLWQILHSNNEYTYAYDSERKTNKQMNKQTQ